MLKYIKWGNLYQNLRIEGQLKFKKLYNPNYMMGYRPPQYRRGLKRHKWNSEKRNGDIDHPNIEN